MPTESLFVFQVAGGSDVGSSATHSSVNGAVVTLVPSATATDVTFANSLLRASFMSSLQTTGLEQQRASASTLRETHGDQRVSTSSDNTDLKSVLESDRSRDENFSGQNQMCASIDFSNSEYIQGNSSIDGGFSGRENEPMSLNFNPQPAMYSGQLTGRSLDSQLNGRFEPQNHNKLYPEDSGNSMEISRRDVSSRLVALPNFRHGFMFSHGPGQGQQQMPHSVPHNYEAVQWQNRNGHSQNCSYQSPSSSNVVEQGQNTGQLQGEERHVQNGVGAKRQPSTPQGAFLSSLLQQTGGITDDEGGDISQHEPDRYYCFEVKCQILWCKFYWY